MMRKLSCLLLILFSGIIAYSQSNVFKEGQVCFDSANYTCAINKFTEAVKILEGKDKQIAEINLSRAKTCAEWLRVADQSFSQRNYKEAKENYQSILDENPNDSYAAQQLNKCIELLIIPPKPTLRKATAQDIKDIWDGKYGKYEERKQNLIKAGIDPDDAQFRINNGEGKPPIQQKQEVSLSLSQSSITFNAFGGSSDQIKVYTNASDFSVSLVPSWCTVRMYSNYFVVSCSPNAGSESRNDWFRISAGDKVKSFYVNQLGNENARITATPSKPAPPPSISISVSKDNLYFPASGGQSEQIKVNTNQRAYSVSLVPSWCKVSIYSGYFYVTCLPNKTGQYRSDCFKVSSGSQELRVIVRQSGITESNSNKKEKSTYLDDCFNCPKSKDTWGLTAGFVRIPVDQNLFLNGLQFGLRINPLFKYGFGMNTGLLFEGYAYNTVKFGADGNFKIEQFTLNIPLHLEYRVNLSKKFNLYSYAGAGFNVVTNNTFEDYTFPLNIEYGGGFRTGHVQFNVGQSLNIGNFSNIEGIGINYGRYQNLVVSMSYLF